MAEGEAIATRTDFVRRAILERRYEPDASYAQDLLALERFLSSRSVGMAESFALSNLLSRYPREAEAIARELGVRPFVPLEDERVSALVDEVCGLRRACIHSGAFGPRIPLACSNSSGVARALVRRR